MPLRISFLTRFSFSFVRNLQQKSRLPVQVFPLDLVHEVEVALVEVVDTDVTVLTTGCVTLAGRIRSDGVLGGMRVSIRDTMVGDQ